MASLTFKNKAEQTSNKKPPIARKDQVAVGTLRLYCTKKPDGDPMVLEWSLGFSAQEGPGDTHASDL